MCDWGNHASGFRQPSEAEVKTFTDRLTRRGANVQVRQSRGLAADAACGQLRMRARQADQQADGEEGQ